MVFFYQPNPRITEASNIRNRQGFFKIESCVCARACVCAVAAKVIAPVRVVHVETEQPYFSQGPLVMRDIKSLCLKKNCANGASVSMLRKRVSRGAYIHVVHMHINTYNEIQRNHTAGGW